MKSSCSSWWHPQIYMTIPLMSWQLESAGFQEPQVVAGTLASDVKSGAFGSLGNMAWKNAGILHPNHPNCHVFQRTMCVWPLNSCTLKTMGNPYSYRVSTLPFIVNPITLILNTPSIVPMMWNFPTKPWFLKGCFILGGRDYHLVI